MKLQHKKQINEILKDKKLLTDIAWERAKAQPKPQKGYFVIKDLVKEIINELKELRTIKKYSEWTSKKTLLEIVKRNFKHTFNQQITDQQIQELKQQDYFIYNGFKYFPITIKITGQTLPVLDGQLVSPSNQPKELKDYLLQGQKTEYYFFI